MNLEDYESSAVQKYRFVVAVAVLKSKPANLTVPEYIEKLRNGIKNEAIQNSDACGNFEMTDDSNIQEELNRIDIDEIMTSSTLNRSVGFVDQTSDAEERTESPSLLECYTQDNDFSHKNEIGCGRSAENDKSIDSNDFDDNMDPDKTFCSDTSDYGKTQIYTVPGEFVPYENPNNDSSVDEPIKDYTNKYDVNIRGSEIFNFKECPAVRESTMGAAMRSHTSRRIGDHTREENENKKTIWETGLCENATKVDTQKTVCETRLPPNSTSVDSEKTICLTQLSQNSTQKDSQSKVCESQPYKNKIRVDTQNTVCETQRPPNSTSVDSEKTICLTQLSQNSTQKDSQSKVCESQPYKNKIRVDTQNTVCQTQRPPNSTSVDSEKTICLTQLSQNSTQKDSQSKVCESQPYKNKIRVDTQNTVCETQRPPNSTSVDSKKTVYLTQLSRNSTPVDSQSKVCGSQPYKNKMRVDTEKTICDTCFHRNSTGAIEKKPQIMNKTRNIIDTTYSQQIPKSQNLSDSVIENSQNTNDKLMNLKSEKRKNLKRSLDKTPKSNSKVIVKPLKSEIVAVSKEKSGRNVDYIQDESETERVNTKLSENRKAKVEIIENVVIRKAESAKQREIISNKTDAQVYIPSELKDNSNKNETIALIKDRRAEGQQNITTTREKLKCNFENVENSKSQEERLEDYSRIINELEQDRTLDSQMYSELVGDIPSTDMFDACPNENNTNADTAVVQNVGRDENFSSNAGPEKLTPEGDLEDSERGERRLTLTIFEVMHKARCYIDSEVSKKSNGFSGDSGYASDRTSGLDLAETTIGHTGMVLYKYLMESAFDVDVHPICDRVSEVLGELVDRLNAEDSRPRFLVEILEKTTSLLGEIFDRTPDHDRVRKEKNVCIFLFLNTSLTILTHTLEKMVQRLEKLHKHLFDDPEPYEISNLEELESQCYLFHVLEILLKRYLEAKQKTRKSEASLTSSSSSTKGFIADIWRSRWNPNHTVKEISTQSQERTCCIWEYKNVLGKIIQDGVRGYSLVSFAALQCYNLLHS